MFVTTVFGSKFDWRDLSKVDLRTIVELDSKALSPLMLCSEAGQDASGKVDALSTEMNQKLLQVSMGSAEVTQPNLIEKSILIACRKGLYGCRQEHRSSGQVGVVGAAQKRPLVCGMAGCPGEETQLLQQLPRKV